MAENTLAPVQNTLDIDTAFKNVTVAVRAYVATAEVHEALTQSLALIRDHLIAYGQVRADLVELRAQLEALRGEKIPPPPVVEQTDPVYVENAQPALS